MAKREEAQKLLKTTRPYEVSHLYKYRSMQSIGLEDIFLKREIYLTDATNLNDPFECRPLLTFHESSIKRERFLKNLTKYKFPSADKKTIKKLMKGKKSKLTDPVFLKKTYEHFISTVGVYCLSEKNDGLLMWSHYSDSHRGICIEFDASKKRTLFWEALKVSYPDRNDLPIVNIMGLAEGEGEEFQKALLTKSDHWKYEEERRVLKYEQDGGPGKYLFSPELLTGVILGARMPAKDKEILVDWIEDYPADINIFQAELKNGKYQVDILLISQA